MRMARAARYSFFAILTVLVVSVVLLLTVDLGRFKGTAENALSDILGREFRIDGEFHVELGRHIYIVAEDVALANAEWGSSDALVEIGRIESRIDAWSIIRSPILIESLDVERTRVNLESDAAGNGNWTFFPAEEAVDEPPAGKPGLPVMLLNASITDFELVYIEPDKPQPFEFSVAEMRATHTDADELQVTLNGDVNDTPVEMTARAGTVSSLIDFSDVKFDLSGQLGEIRFGGQAMVADLAEPRHPSAKIEVQGPNVEYLTSILKMQQVTTGPLDLTATVAPINDRMQLLINGTFGEFAVDVAGLFVDLQDFDNVELRVATSGPDANVVARLFGIDTLPADPFGIVGKFSRSGAVVAAEDIKISVGKSIFELGGRFENFPDPRSASAGVQINGPDFGRFNRLLGLPGKLGGPFTLDATLAPLANGGATIGLQARAEDLQFTVAGDVSNDPDFIGTRIDATFVGPNLQTVAAAVGLDDAPAQPFELTMVAERVAAGASIEAGTLTIADDRLSVSGLVGNSPLEADTDVRFEASGPDLAKTLAAFGRDADELPNDQYQASGRIERDADYFLLHDVAASIGREREYELTVDGRISTQAKFAGTRVRIGTTGASLGALTDAAGIEGMPDLPFAAAAVVERVADGFSVEDGSVELGEDRIELRGLVGEKPLEAGTNVHVDARAPDLKSTLQRFGIDLEALPAGPLHLTGGVRHQGEYFDVQDLKASLAGNNVSANGRLGAFPELDGTALTVQVDGPDLSLLLPDEERFSALNKPYGLSAKVGLRDDGVFLEDLAAFIDQTRLDADVDFSLSPTLGSGRFSVTATSPDLFRLSPEHGEKFVVQQAPLEFRASGNWADNFWKLDELSMQLANGELASSGTFGGPPTFQDTNLSFDMDIASVRNFSAFAGRELPDDPARLTFHLVGGGDSLALQDFKGEFGNSDITGNFSAQTGGDVLQFNVSLLSDRLNLAPYQTEPPDEPQPTADTTAVEHADGRVIPDVAIPMDTLANYLGSVDIQIGEVVLRYRTLRDIVLSGVIEDGSVHISQFNLRSSQDETLTGGFSIQPVESGAELKLIVEGSGLRIGLPSSTEEELLQLPQYDIDTVLHATGKTVRELAGSVDGYFRLVAGQGTLRTTALKFFSNDFLLEVLGSVNPFSKSDPNTNFECGVIVLKIDDGKLVGEPALIAQTERLRVLANTEIDLKTEELDAVINTVPRKGLGLSVSSLLNPFIKIDGTLADPTLNLDPEGVVVEGGIAVATGGLSFLAKRFKDRFLSAQDPCGNLLEKTDADVKATKALYYPDYTPQP